MFVTGIFHNIAFRGAPPCFISAFSSWKLLYPIAPLYILSHLIFCSMLFRVFYYFTLLIFLAGALVFWVYTNQFFHWLGDTLYSNTAAFDRTVPAREAVIWAVVCVSFVCLVLSIFALSWAMKRWRFVAYMSLLMSAITIVMFIISFFGHGVIPTRGIL